MMRPGLLHADAIASKETLESARLQTSSAELRVKAAREGVTQGRAMLEKAEDDLRKTTIFSPLTGRVIALNAEQGEVVVSGTMNNPASVIGTVADLSEILAEVDVDETEVVDVRPGLPAEVVVDALPDVRYAGEVVEVGSSGYTRPAQPDVQFFRVKILLSAPDERLRSGMTTDIDITSKQQDGVLRVPVHALVIRDGKNFVRIPSGETYQEVEVQVGLRGSEGFVEIIGGLTEGQEIITEVNS